MTGATPAAGASALDETPATSALRGLSAQESEQSAAVVLASVPWDGLPPDPDALSAREFLGLL